MKYKLTEQDINLLNRAKKITLTNYGIDDLGYIEVDNLLSAIDDLYREVEYQQEKYTNLKDDMELHYQLRNEYRSDY